MHHRSRVSVKTISEAAKVGARSPEIAKRLSAATGGEVTAAGLLGVEA